ncbi:penicillin acylase family protein [Actinokineospora sp.]|uniref:penicillin acylase family protein n=1 Tax=Actinokineospora sp. TaxID=1872133 RepID=UPI00403827F3
MARARNLACLAAALAVAGGVVVGQPAYGASAPLPPRAVASFAPGDYCLGQCADIVPPGQNGSATLVEILAHKAFGTQPKHADDQLGRYDALAKGYPGLTTDKITNFFNDASFGVPPNQVESTRKPRADVTIIRDKATGTPHIYGTTRSGTTFGAGYAAAQDRLFLMDVLRRVGRGQLTPFAGGAAANQQLEQSFFADAPYTEAELQRQVDDAAALGPRGALAIADARSYVDGINQYIREAYTGRYFPGEYVLLGHVDAITNAGRIEPFKLTDLAVISSVIGAQFGGGGGGEVQAAIAKLAIQERYGVVEGERVWQGMRAEDDPEHITTVHNGQSFPYGKRPANPQGAALPDKGSVTAQQLVFDRTGTAATATAPRARTDVTVPNGISPTTPDGKPNLEAAKGILADGVLPGDLLENKHGMSNALLVSGAHTANGNPVAVFGPQTGYFAPQLLMLQELQGPGISARGASFAGISFYVLLGRGQDYSWSATSSGQDITDTYAVDLCAPDGSPVTKDSTHYRLRGQCVPLEVVERKNSWFKSVGSPAEAGSYTLRGYRTKYGPVTHRGTIGGRPVAYSQLRSTYQHELDAVIGFQQFNDPDAIRSAADFQRAAADVSFTFNWFYADADDIAYYNSGSNPVRQSTVDPSMPVLANAGYDWVNWNPDTNRAAYTPDEQHANAVNQDYLISWNNGQAPGTAAAGLERQSVHRGDLLDARVKTLVRSGTPVDRVSLTKAMAEAALVDLRAERILPLLFRVIGDGAISDPATATAVAELKQWKAAGGQRKETTQGSKTYANANAVKLLDAWWPLLVKAQFQPGLGDAAYTELTRTIKIDETPSTNNAHQGSSYQSGWWGYVHKDLRTILGDPVQAPLGAQFCGAGNVGQCRQILLDTLKQAAATPKEQVYRGDGNCAAGDQWCADAIVHNALGGLTHKPISTQNRPTYQQVVQFPARRGDAIANLSAGASATASSYERGLFYSLPPHNAIDGNLDTRWASERGDNQSFTVNLGSVRPVSRAVLKWEAAYGSAYRIQVSTTGTTWRDVWSTTTGDGGTDIATFARTDARFVRMQGVTRATEHGYSLYEFDVYSK